MGRKNKKTNISDSNKFIVSKKQTNKQTNKQKETFHIVVLISSNSCGNKMLLLALAACSIYVIELKAAVTYAKISGKTRIYIFS